MAKLLVLYGHPNDPAAFDKSYQEIHIPLAKRMQGLKSGPSAECSVRPMASHRPTTMWPNFAWKAAKHSRRCSRHPQARQRPPMSRTMPPAE